MKNFDNEVKKQEKKIDIELSEKQFEAIKQINGRTKYALTGTPIENSLSELWSIFDFLMPGYLFSYNKFKEKYEIPILSKENNEAMEKLKKSRVAVFGIGGVGGYVCEALVRSGGVIRFD